MSRIIKNRVDATIRKFLAEQRIKEKDSKFYIETSKCYAVKVSNYWKIYSKEDDKPFGYSNSKKQAIRIMNEREERKMTVKDLLETTDYCLYQIVNPDYRGCKLMNKTDFINYYKNTNVYNDEIKSYSKDYYECKTYCSILL